MSLLRPIENTFNEVYSSLKANWRFLFSELLKLELISLALGFVFLIVIGIIMLLTFGSIIIPLIQQIISGIQPDLGNNIFLFYTCCLDYSIVANLFASLSSSWPLFVSVGLIVMIAFIVTILLQYALSSVSLNIIANSRKNEKTNILEQMKTNLWPNTRYMIIVLFILGIFVSPIFLTFLSVDVGAKFALFCGGVLIAGTALIIYSFLVQFSYFELILNKKGVFNSFKASYNLVRKNLLSVVVFDIVLLIVSVLAYVPFFAVQQIIDIIFRLVVSLTTGNIPLLIIVVIAYLLISMAIGIVSTIVGIMIGTNIMYSYWKELQKPVEEIQTKTQKPLSVRPTKKTENKNVSV